MNFDSKLRVVVSGQVIRFEEWNRMCVYVCMGRGGSRERMQGVRTPAPPLR